MFISGLLEVQFNGCCTDVTESVEELRLAFELVSVDEVDG